jgi:hypothetical protein
VGAAVECGTAALNVRGAGGADEAVDAATDTARATESADDVIRRPGPGTPHVDDFADDSPT